MSATNYTPIYLYNSGTATNTPLAANLGAGELAINYADGKLFYKDNSSAIQVIGWKTTPTTAGGTGLTSYTAGDLPYYASGSTLSKLGIGTSGYVLQSNGSAPTWVAQSTLSVGTATNATNTAITDNTSSSATWYPTIVSATTGNLPQTTSSTKLSFVPSTGTLTATGFAGALNGTVGATTASTGAFTTLSASSTVSGTAFIPSSATVPTNGMFLSAANTVGFATNSAQAMQISSTGGVSIGNTTDPGASNLNVNGTILSGTTSVNGSASNTANIVGGRFSTLTYAVTANYNVAYTVFTVPSGLINGTYIVSCGLTVNNATAYNAVSIVSVDGTSIVNTVIKAATNMVISLSGYAIQATQLTGGNGYVIYATITRVS
jgi:hypothetical protein